MSLGIKLVNGESITFLDESLPNTPCTPLLQDMEKILDKPVRSGLCPVQCLTRTSVLQNQTYILPCFIIFVVVLV